MKLVFKIQPRTIAALFVISITCAAANRAEAQAAQPQYPVPGGGFVPAAQQTPVLPALPASKAITPDGTVVEDVVARVNDQIITRSEYERSELQLAQEAQQNNMPPDELAQRQRDMLRDMIDQQLLLSKGKELDINGDAETIRRLDEIRKENHLDSMEALEKAASQQGVSFEDFKSNIRNNVITQQVVRDEVGRRLQMTHAQEETYYNAHLKDFEQPEQVHLSEILIPTPDSATDAQLAASQAKADDVAAKLKAGGKFADLAKQFSGGPTASAGGDLGDFKRGTLGDVLENATFPLAAGATTAPIRTKQGFVLLRVDSHTAAGAQPLSAVEEQVQQAIYLDQLQPALREYLTKARNEAYVDIKPGFVDSGSTKKEVKPVFTTYTAPTVKKKDVAKQREEQERDARAQQELAFAKQNAAAKAAAKAAKTSATSGGVKNVSMPVKPVKIHREKIRYGQAPRKALPDGVATTTDAGATGSPAAGSVSNATAGAAPGSAITQTDATTILTAGTGGEDADPLVVRSGPQKKTRYTDRQKDVELAKANDREVKAEAHVNAHPTQATPEENVDEKQQAAPLGLNGDTVKKTKPTKVKGAPKERMQEKPKSADTPAPAVAPTVNPAIAATPTALEPAKPAPSADQTTLPPVDSGAPGAPPQSLPPATNPVPASPQP